MQFGRCPTAPAEVGGFLTPLTAVGHTLGKGLSVPLWLMGDRFALATQILILMDQLKNATHFSSTFRHWALLVIMGKKCGFSKLVPCQGERNFFLSGYLIM